MNIPFDPEIAERFKNLGHINGTGPEGGYSFDIDISVPYIATAIHAGHRVRKELLPLMSISEEARLFEEDPATDTMIRGCRSTVWALDSRAEYDLNRPSELALPLSPERFWGVSVYKEQPDEKMNMASLEKYEAFYLFMGTCITVLLERFGHCIIYDIHSYNISRQVEKGIANPPVFNLGTALLDRKRWDKAIKRWLECLGDISIPGIEVSAAENLVFFGKGELCRRLSAWNENILVLPTEVSKIYMDEHKGVIYPEIVEAIKEGLASAVAIHSFQS
ncbi:MAG TPA: N-formylglutamate amidohydrolase [Desulfomonilia bacterium]